MAGGVLLSVRPRSWATARPPTITQEPAKGWLIRVGPLMRRSTSGRASPRFPRKPPVPRQSASAPRTPPLRGYRRAGMWSVVGDAQATVPAGLAKLGAHTGARTQRARACLRGDGSAGHAETLATKLALQQMPAKLPKLDPAAGGR